MGNLGKRDGAFGIGVAFEWTRYSDYKIEYDEPSKELGASLLSAADAGPRLVGVGSFLKTAPLENFPELFQEVLKYGPTINDHLRFARKYGLLRHRSQERLFQWKGCRESLKRLVDMADGEWEVVDGVYRDYQIKGAFNAVIIKKDDRLEVSVSPDTLYAALVLQLGISRASGAQSRRCRQCENLFEVGGRTGGRQQKAFCSAKCRAAFSYALRKQA